MKKILLTLVAIMMLCLGASAQQYVMKITKADGSTVEVNADDIKDVTFVQTGTTPIVLGPHHFDLTVTVGFRNLHDILFLGAHAKSEHGGCN